ncbi:MAG: hypothetical protein U9Q98_04820 [Bacteroidota bacterium]|nr:hypothetical protein [Bacteroidota bacterium]
MRYYIICFNLLIISFTGCLHKNGDKQSAVNKQYEKSYKIASEEFSDTMINHFPQIIGDTFHVSLNLPKFEKKRNRYGFTVLFKTSAQKVENLSESLEKEYIEVGFYEKNSLIINHKNEIKSVTKKDSLLPLPNIPKIFESNNQKMYFSDLEMNKYKFFIINSAQGNFLGKDYLTDGKGLPEEWKNGYSKGIAINEKDNELIYWLEIW